MFDSLNGFQKFKIRINRVVCLKCFPITDVDVLEVSWPGLPDGQDPAHQINLVERRPEARRHRPHAANAHQTALRVGRQVGLRHSAANVLILGGPGGGEVEGLPLLAAHLAAGQPQHAALLQQAA